MARDDGARRAIPCRLKPLYAVFTSALDRSLRDVALAHAWFADDDGGNIWPATETIAEMVGCDVRTVQRARRPLEYLGVLVAEDRRSSGGRGRTTRYKLDFEALARLKPGHPLGPPERVTAVSGFRAGKGDSGVRVSGREKGDTGGRKGRHQTPERVTPEAERVTSEAEKGDTAVTRSVRNHQEPSVPVSEHTAADAAARAHDEEDRTRFQGIPGAAIERSKGNFDLAVLLRHAEELCGERGIVFDAAAVRQILEDEVAARTAALARLAEKTRAQLANRAGAGR